MEVWLSMIFVVKFECNSFLDSKGIITPMLQPPILQVDENVVKKSSRGMGWWDLFHMFFFGSKSWIQKKSCNPGQERMAVCYHWEQPASCFEDLFLLPLAWLTQISEPLLPRLLLPLSRCPGTWDWKVVREKLTRNNREVFWQSSKIQRTDKRNIKIQQQQRIAKKSAWNCQSMTKL